ncbi:hypothetical protein CSB45_05125 [candidate division KSB3 bacterium]|uniref:WbqC family protein n=1 Tax=candidate division KSB3 bacterium TaxID=2044937 RepID=A0A2G6E7N5_9BACT|nr:MAG: hypothetical protein CSB45_05125 [candidate division KSB3 bacterium]PIE30437.1 MAG: hypothetical protein CSA57_03890 [candidate division KSB3 bacterium]
MKTVSGTKTVAILQSNYIPWKGYFDIIHLVDEFILYDDVQYTVRDWRNRNRIKTPNGLIWLTIPVIVKGRRVQKIRDVRISHQGWARKHWQSLIHNYSKTQYFSIYKNIFEELYLNCHEKFLSLVNYRFLTALCGILGITTKISWSMEYSFPAKGKTEQLIALCKEAGAAGYLSGPAAKAYMNEELFKQEGIKLNYMNYSGYPEYHQRFPPFEHRVSILDLIFNEGPAASKYMKSF